MRNWLLVFLKLYNCDFLAVFLTILIVSFYQDWLAEDATNILCSTCYEKLKIAYDYKIQCLEVDNNLRFNLNNDPIKIEQALSIKAECTNQENQFIKESSDDFADSEFVENVVSEISSENLEIVCTLRNTYNSLFLTKLISSHLRK